MHTPSQFSKKNHSILPVALFLLAFAIAFWFTYDAYIEYAAKTEEVAVAMQEQDTTGKTLEHLDAVKTETTS